MSAFSALPRCALKILAAIILVFGALPAFALESAPVLLDSPLLPSSYGQVIYQKNPSANNQIYIIGQAHRSSVDGKNGEKTVRAQMEIYRIGEWLIRQRKVELLLPEGFFQSGEARTAHKPQSFFTDEAAFLDNQSLRTQLQDTRKFVSADILLSRQFRVTLAQVEDENLYHTVVRLVRELAEQRGELNEGLFKQLDDFQKKRSVAMLKNIPAAVESAYQNGGTENKHAIFTIGMAHLSEIIDFLREERIGTTEGKDDLLHGEYGVTVILPRSLAEDEAALRLTRLSHLKFQSL
ncbi:hypothetical protein SAMN05660860_03491 [Geoalkalibacter ferrihydriticus]|uniref:Uncharacterized protein n=2 Tax=Geoalkalibacter ferrihydriticus TaxID=392333 RepID=A0A0C2DRD5_9BACT|nr:hypothetical protein [Geoalkalibacter ferrihydriticus]KIH76004.1 hypothetical protein GFER_14020 [Geoalkalibacter ferrihydriticus DSM 17813]SDM97522.1 hypothetical protein SAMN05660860_03491 [Geoalkalibacter ferrihydriticus]